MAPAILTRRPRILYLDAYDSFSNNIIAQVEQCIDAEVVKRHIDDDPLNDQDESPGVTAKAQCQTKDRRTAFVDYVKGFDAVIAGPGPGWAKCDEDVGLMKELWKLRDDDLLPVLGICLGFQSMCLAFGAEVHRLEEPRHGLVSEILHKGRSVFNGVEQLLATQYHSLQVMIGHSIQQNRTVRHPAELWESTALCPDLEPLAWDFDSKRNGAVLMAAKHASKPFWGVQFHPESICTNSEGTRIIENWWNEAQSWERRRRFSGPTTMRKNSLSPHPSGSMSVGEIRSFFTMHEPKRGSGQVPFREHHLPLRMALDDMIEDKKSLHPDELASLITQGTGESRLNLSPSVVHCSTTGSGRLTVADVVELLDVSRTEAIVLESGLQADLLPMAVGTGQHSIIGVVIPGETFRLHYYAGRRIFQLRDGRDEVYCEWFAGDPWAYIRAVMVQLSGMVRQPPITPTLAPFWGGLMGYASYEAGLETIEVKAGADSKYPDICFAYITRSIVFDHQLKKIYVQSIRGREDRTWVAATLEKIYEAVGKKSRETTPNPTPLPKANPFEQDATLNNYLASCKQFVANRKEYCASVASCQSSIADGQSYELCLTTTNEIRARRPRVCRLLKSENNELSWKLYKRLASNNTAPFSAYMRLHSVHILSSSPERYISWDRQQTAQCRPIKGTVAKKSGVTPADAHAILSSPKERAENLMIVDLVRHQLHGVYGSGNVHVEKLMEVEEYETLWQLVSVINAIPRGVHKPRTPNEWEEPAGYVSVPKATHHSRKDSAAYLGFDAFAHSLPPGSMTGAPKKRSCELLQHEEEGQRRGIYSGVLGYLDIGGGGDFSVVIRTAVKIDDPDSPGAKEDVWKIGAGGAITSQSTPEAEYEEMLGKFQSTARAFRLEQREDRLRGKVEGDRDAERFEEVPGAWRSAMEELVRLEFEIRRLGVERFGERD